MAEPGLSLEALLPHRGGMLLLDSVVDVGEHAARSRVTVHGGSSFFSEGRGVPAWVGLEYMGQTAALIAGYQLQRGELEPHVGLFLGTRRYESSVGWFAPGQVLDIRCEEQAVAGTMATFACTIAADQQSLAESTLSVFRQPIQD